MGDGQQAYQGAEIRTRSRSWRRRPAWRWAAGCEILLHSDAVQAHAESYIGLVECGVGLSCRAGAAARRCWLRWKASGKLPGGPMPAPAKVFEMVSTATTSKSAAEARELLFLRPEPTASP